MSSDELVSLNRLHAARGSKGCTRRRTVQAGDLVVAGPILGHVEEIKSLEAIAHHGAIARKAEGARRKVELVLPEQRAC